MEGKPDWQLEWEAEQRGVLSSANFPVFAPEGLPLELGGWGGGDGEPVDSLTLRHDIESRREIEVHSEFEDGDVDLESTAAERIEDHTGAKVERVDTKPIRVDGVQRPFAFASGGGRWVAVGQVGAVTVTVEAFGFDPNNVHLRTLADPTQVIGGSPEYRPQRPALDVLDSRRVVELAMSTPVAAVGRQLAAAAKPAIALVVTDGPSSSWLGGEPQLPAETRWPAGNHGPMMFIAQLSLADLDATVWTGPRSGHLHVFCDVDPEDGSLEGEGACAVLHSPAGGELRPHRFPPDLHRDSRLPEQPARPSVGLTVPDQATVMDQLGIALDPNAAEALWALRDRLHAEQGWHNVAGQLLGWPHWQNDDGMDHLAELGGGQAPDWSLLLQTDRLDAELYIALATADLTAGRFNRAQATIEFD
jgi:hypothetical protein